MHYNGITLISRLAYCIHHCPPRMHKLRWISLRTNQVHIVTYGKSGEWEEVDSFGTAAITDRFCFVLTKSRFLCKWHAILLYSSDSFPCPFMLSLFHVRVQAVCRWKMALVCFVDNSKYLLCPKWAIIIWERIIFIWLYLVTVECIVMRKHQYHHNMNENACTWKSIESNKIKHYIQDKV